MIATAAPSTVVFPRQQAHHHELKLPYHGTKKERNAIRRNRPQQGRVPGRVRIVSQTFRSAMIETANVPVNDEVEIEGPGALVNPIAGEV